MQSGTRKKQKMTTNLFRMTQFRKNASVTPLVSHTFKTKDLKPSRITHFQKTVGVTPTAEGQNPLGSHNDTAKRSTSR
jgi:hypothetical protein